MSKVAKINSFFDPRKCRFSKINSREIFQNWWFNIGQYFLVFREKVVSILGKSGQYSGHYTDFFTDHSWKTTGWKWQGLQWQWGWWGNKRNKIGNSIEEDETSEHDEDETSEHDEDELFTVSRSGRVAGSWRLYKYLWQSGPSSQLLRSSPSHNKWLSSLDSFIQSPDQASHQAARRGIKSCPYVCQQVQLHLACSYVQTRGAYFSLHFSGLWENFYHCTICK